MAQTTTATATATKVMNRDAHPATWGKGPVPRQVSGLFYNNQAQGRDFGGGFFIARGAATEHIPATSKGSALIIWNKDYVIGLLRNHQTGKTRVLSHEELQQVERWRNARAEAAEKANELSAQPQEQTA